MNFWNVLYKVAKKSGCNTTDIGPKMGLSRGYISSCKTQNVTPLIDNAIRMLDVCGYSLCAIPSDEIPDNAFVVD